MTRKSNKALAMVAVGLTPAAVVITGCGGGGGHTAVLAPGPTANRGVLTLKVTFPKRKSGSAASKSGRVHVGRSQGGGSGAYDGSIPQGTLSVKVVLLNPTTGAALALPQVIQAPPNGSVSTPQTVSFTNLPVGPVRAQVQAFPTVMADAAQGPGEANPIAAGASDAQIVANQTVASQVLLQLTIDHITLTPSNATLTTSPGQNTVTLTAQAFDQNNAPLIYPFTFATSDPNVAMTYQLDNQTVAVDANNSGTAIITATEVNSQLSAASNVTVIFNGD